MCGIVGYADPAGPTISRADLDRARDAIVHRGPDDAGTWISPGGNLGLATRRLKIIDLSERGHQPLIGGDGSAISFNGELYNYRDLRKTLQTAWTFRSDSDTEVILAAYAVWGDAFIDRLNGMFAFALADVRQRRLILARDRVGEKPLYYMHRNSQLLWASEPKALLQLPGVAARLDPSALNEFLAFGYQPPDHSAFAGIDKLPPGHVAVYELVTGRLGIRRYWQLPVFRGIQHEDPVARLDSLLDRSVQLRLVSDVPLGISLSGGVDSSLVAAMAARHVRGRLNTFTVGLVDDPAHDERKFARVVANLLGTDHHELVIDHDVSGYLPELIAQFDEPLADSSLVPTYAIARLIRQHVTVVLGGDGGDELFGGYAHYQRVLALRRARWLPSFARRAIAAKAQSLFTVGRPGRTMLAGMAGDDVEAYMSTVALFGARDRAALLSPRMLKAIGPLGAPEQRRVKMAGVGDAVQRLTRLDFLTYLPEDILTKVDRATMRVALEARAPWLDPELVDFAFGDIPSGQKAFDGTLKWLPKRLAAKLLPGLPLNRKQGFSIPLRSWIVSAWREQLETGLRALERAEVVDAKAVRRLVQSQEAGFSNSERLFALLMLGQWMLKYRVLT
jgi:asparagine synthase (glutamine-hydrolysing)